MYPACMFRVRLCVRAQRNVLCKRSFSNGFIQDNILMSPNVELQSISLPELLIPKCQKFEKFVAFECAQTGRKYTFGQIRNKSTNLDKALRKILRLEKNDVIGIHLKNIPEYPIALLGASLANLIVTTINSAFTADELSRQLTDSGAKAVITSVDLFDVMKTACNKAKIQIPIIVVKTKADHSIPERAIIFSELTDTDIDYPDMDPPNPNDIALLPYSSGTTSFPKGVELTHNNLTANLQQMMIYQNSYVFDAEGEHQECTPGIIPIYHSYGLIVANLFVMYGGKTVTFPDFSPDLFISQMQKHKNTLLYFVPSLVMLLTNHPAVLKKYLEHVKALSSGASPLGANDEKRFYDTFGSDIALTQGYGLTEASPMIASITKEIFGQYRDKCAGSVGRLIPGTIGKVISADGDSSSFLPLGPNVTGELLVKGPQIMKGYLNNPKETEKTIVDDGWLRTGDEAYYNNEGMIFITDRLKEMIKVKGFQVAPAELEELLRSHPDVADAAVIGIAHTTYGEIPRAYIVPKNKKINLENVNKFVSEKVTHYKQLKGGIVLMENIPKNGSGKILRRVLKEEYLKQMQL